jgi:hypothetical protein
MRNEVSYFLPTFFLKSIQILATQMEKPTTAVSANMPCDTVVGFRNISQTT